MSMEVAPLAPGRPTFNSDFKVWWGKLDPMRMYRILEWAMHVTLKGVLMVNYCCAESVQARASGPKCKGSRSGRNGDEATGVGLTHPQFNRAGAPGHLDSEREADGLRDTSEGVKEYGRRCTVFKEEPSTNKDRGL